MKLAKGLLGLGALGLFAACRTEEPENVQVAIICEAELVDSTGVVVASLEDTTTVDAPIDSVGTDPRPCKSSFNSSTRSMTLNEKTATDSASGSPVD